LQLIKRGAEADIYAVEWAGKKAISKIRLPKPYRHNELDVSIRKHRTIHEANFMAVVKTVAGIISPFVYFVDPLKAEIIMEFVEGEHVRDILTTDICYAIGCYAALLHAKSIIHGDLTTSNFIIRDGKLVLLDFGLARYSERIEDMATDIRLMKEVFTSAHNLINEASTHFIKGYARIAGEKKTSKILENVREIERRGRYARMV
jgi:TP53 regulating kinase-like protein